MEFAMPLLNLTGVLHEMCGDTLFTSDASHPSSHNHVAQASQLQEEVQNSLHRLASVQLNRNSGLQRCAGHLVRFEFHSMVTDKLQPR